MALKFQEFVETCSLWAVLAGLVLFSLCSGCKAYAQDDNTFTVTFGTSLTFASVGPKKTDTRAEAGLDFQDWVKKPIVEWMIDSDGDGEFDQSGELNDETVDDLIDDGGGE